MTEAKFRLNPLQINSNLPYESSQFDKQKLDTSEQPFGQIQQEVNPDRFHSEKKKSRFRLSQDIKAQECKKILSKVQNLKVPKEIFHNKDRYSQDEYNKFQKKVAFKGFNEFTEMPNNETIVTIEYLELNETSEKFTTTALELADIIKRRFPFIDVIIKNLKKFDEVQEFHPYGLFEVQIIAKQGLKAGILYSKKISYLLPSPNKIIQEICKIVFKISHLFNKDMFVDKIDLEIEFYDILESVKVLTPNGLVDNKLNLQQLKGVEVILRQKVPDYSVNRKGDFLLYGIKKPISKKNKDPSCSLILDKNEVLSPTLGSSKSILFTRANQFDGTITNISGGLSAHSKQNPVKTFMVKGITNEQCIVKFKDIVIDVDTYEIELYPSSHFSKEKILLHLKQSVLENSHKIRIGLRSKNIAEVNINLYDELTPLMGGLGLIKISNLEIPSEIEQQNKSIINGSHKNFVFELRESETSPGNYNFFAEPGIYYIQVLAEGYRAECRKINLQRGENIHNIQMKKKILTKIIFQSVDLFNMYPVHGVQIMIYDQRGQLIASGLTNQVGEFSNKLEIGEKLKISTEKEDYISLCQEYVVNTSAIIDKIIIKMIAKAKKCLNDFEIIASFPGKTFNIALQAICPDQSVVDEINPQSSKYNLKYDEMVSEKNNISMISYKSQTPRLNQTGNQVLEFEIQIKPKNLLNSGSTRLIKSQVHKVSLQSINQNGLYLSSPTQKLSRRLSASSLFLDNRLSFVDSPSYNSSYTNCLSTRNAGIQMQNENNNEITVEDISNIVDLNDCLRVYVIYRNTLQDVFYCCFKNLAKKNWKIGIIKAADNTFVKINSPDMKYIEQNQLYKNETKKESYISTIDLRSCTNSSRDLRNGYFSHRRSSFQSNQTSEGVNN